MRKLFLLGVLAVSGSGSAVAAPQYPMMGAEETNALSEIRSQRSEGLIAVQPWVQLLGANRLGVGWLTAKAADGLVEWTQDTGAGATSQWRRAFFAEDGLIQAGGTSQRAIVEGYDPSKPIRLRARSRPISVFKPYKVAFDASETSQERSLPALAHPRGAVSFVVFNDIHNREQLYPLLMARVKAPVDFAVFNGDVLQDPQSEQELTDHLLLPMAWFAQKSVPCFFLRGNHETRGAFARTMKAYLTLPENRYYTAMTFGAARVLMLDSGEDKADTSPEYSGLVDFDRYVDEELVWLKREIAGEAFKQAAWRIAIMHIPPDWRVEEPELWHGQRRARERFARLFDEGNVTVVISGHTHKAALVEPCPDPSRGFRWPIFVGGSHPLSNATVIRVDAEADSLKVQRIHSDGTVGAERSWRAPQAAAR